MSRYEPPVPDHFYSVRFVPIIDGDENPRKVGLRGTAKCSPRGLIRGCSFLVIPDRSGHCRLRVEPDPGARAAFLPLLLVRLLLLRRPRDGTHAQVNACQFLHFSLRVVIIIGSPEQVLRDRDLAGGVGSRGRAELCLRRRGRAQDRAHLPERGEDLLPQVKKKKALS